MLLLSLCGKAQDVIVRNDSTKLYCKVIELGENYVVVEQNGGSRTRLSTQHLAYYQLPGGYSQKFSYAAVPLSEFEIKRQRYIADSSSFFKYRESVAINYLPMINRELSFIYTKENYQKQLQVVIPFSIGLSKPKLTLKHYFQNNFTYMVQQKLFDLGIGLNYLPSYRTRLNFFVGPLFKCMVFNGKQVILPNTNVSFQQKSTVLLRNTLSFTTGAMLRTKSRLNFSTFISLGAAYDVVPVPIKRESDGKRINPISDPFNFYFSAGFTIGYCF